MGWWSGLAPASTSQNSSWRGGDGRSAPLASGAVKKEKSFLLAKISTDIFYTRSEIKNEFFISLARLIIKFEPTPIVETSFHYGAGIFIRLAP